MKKIAVVGSLNMDYVAYVERAPRAGETLLSRRFECSPGGKGANQAYALGKMGAAAAMFGAVGEDGNGDMLLNNLRSVNVDISHVMRTQEPTGIALITVDESTGENRIVVTQGANNQVTCRYIDSVLKELLTYDIVIFQLEIPLETVVYAAARLKEQKKTVILDPAPAPGPLPDELLKAVDYLKPNETELEILSGIAKDVEKACEKLTEAGALCVLASLGEKGVYLADNTGGRLYGTRPVEAVDTTAAGDSFTAAFAFALSEGKNVDAAIDFAQKVAGIVVQRPGAQTSIPHREEIDQLCSSK